MNSDYIHGRTEKIEDLPEDFNYYGPFFEIVNYDFSISLMDSFRMLQVDAFHILIILSFAAGVFFFFKLVRLMYGSEVAFFASLFLLLHPILFAHAHYNSKDIPLLAGFIVILYFLYSGFFERKFWKILTAGGIFGFLLAIRADALIVFPVFFAPYLIFLFFGLRTPSQAEWMARLKKDMAYLGAFLGAGGLALFLGWPRLWKDPLFFFASVKYFLHHGWIKQALYFGKATYAANLPWRYSPFFVFATTSTLIIVLFFFGIAKMVRDFKSGKNIFALWLVIFWFFTRLIVGMKPHSIRYYGVRHFLIVIPPLLVIAALGFVDVLSRTRKYKFHEKLRWTAIAFVLLWLAVEFFLIYPFGDAYYNETVRLALGPKLEKKFDFEYWGASYRQGMDWLNRNAAPSSSFCVHIAGHLIQYYPIRADLTYDCSENANYLMFITRWAFAPENFNETFHFEGKEPVFKISRYNSNLWVKFEK